MITSTNGSTLTLANNGAGPATISNSGGNHTIAVPIWLGSNLSVTDSPGSTLTVSGPIGETNAGTSLSVSGGGTLVLSGSNTYSGGTTVSGGTLKVANAAGSATGSGPVTVDAGATLSGSGIIGGPLEIAGELGPGDSPEILTVNNQVAFEPAPPSTP